ncbi:MAG TPA: glycosyltransferase family A protein [Ignavibacteriaceae bacterium]|nr:glycosyltransferase family A protein [Ignavibacteriaceae bacterium]
MTNNNGDALVSIILPVYNREDYLERCINSILKQTYSNWELIAIDDGSKDESLKILSGYSSLYQNISVIKQVNKKLAKSRNRGIELAGGKYLTFIDSDDEYTPDHIKKRIDYFELNPDVDLIHGGVKIIGNEFVPDKNQPGRLIHLSECYIGGTFLGKREVFLDLKGFKSIPYSEDSDFLERAEKKFNVRKVFYQTYIYHRELDDSITKTYGEESV